MGKSTARKSTASHVPPNRPPLTPRTSVEEFRRHYWYLADLAHFCRENGLKASGQKHELVARVETFLMTGNREDPTQAREARPSARATRGESITPDTIVTEDYKCDERTREFFKALIGPNFHFTAELQRFRRERQKNGIRTTYGDLAREWLAERDRRKQRGYKSQIGGEWRYNQFVRDFLADKERNAGKHMRDAARAWNLIRDHTGPKSYAEYVRAGLARKATR
jgi:SAP domain-containing new25/Domain of unknown function (DUF6434)